MTTLLLPASLLLDESQAITFNKRICVLDLSDKKLLVFSDSDRHRVLLDIDCAAIVGAHHNPERTKLNLIGYIPVKRWTGSELRRKKRTYQFRFERGDTTRFNNWLND